ncbi:ErfK/YbiS/YcfS/YnhG family protein [Fibrisoma limi BUZ 3]|uniref:ErfK/YbiS/YcfS/YnhG family protein n=1 Tax=Fibrisoma limi BUZ 3 TaxID=1185876 RepID=I2GIR1_9BACT|nr:L,D-transpeptidase family protein [Fibrisoma limi]CCH53786.1 ErfK/YbiS/YcfS/YnhG family protein [Fibrisoma limi BUZ 3]
MRPYLLLFVFIFTFVSAYAQTTGDWNRLRNYAYEIGIEIPCDQPDRTCLTRYVTEIVYGHSPRRISYQGVAERLDTARIDRLTEQFLAGADWCPLLDSLESHDRAYQQLKAYCMRCLVDDYMADSLTLEQVRETLNTYRWLNRFDYAQRVIVNIPSATLRLIDRRGSTQLWSRVIVGQPRTPTPVMTAMIPSLVMYPYWNVPRSITVRELLPKIRKNPTVLLEQLNMQVVSGSGRVIDPTTVDWTVPATSFPYRLRQSTGCDNALGLLKFNVANPYDIYLHDTNARGLFSRENRFLSHGCIRVEKPAELANQLLGYSRFQASYLASCPANAQPKPINLPQAIPLLITYNVLDIDEAGAIRVYPDAYNWWRITL